MCRCVCGAYVYVCVTLREYVRVGAFVDSCFVACVCVCGCVWWLHVCVLVLARVCVCGCVCESVCGDV